MKQTEKYCIECVSYTDESMSNKSVAKYLKENDKEKYNEKAYKP